MNYSIVSYVNQIIFNNYNHYEDRFFPRLNVSLLEGKMKICKRMYYITGASKVTSYFNIFLHKGQSLGLYSACLDVRVENLYPKYSLTS